MQNIPFYIICNFLFFVTLWYFFQWPRISCCIFFNLDIFQFSTDLEYCAVVHEIQMWFIQKKTWKTKEEKWREDLLIEIENILYGKLLEMKSFGKWKKGKDRNIDWWRFDSEFILQVFYI